MAVDIVTAVSPAPREMERHRRSLYLIVFAVLWGLITHGTYAGTGDEPHYQILAHSLVFDRDLDVTTDYANPTNRSLGGRFEPGAHIRPGKDGRLRPVHDIGLPLLFAPYYAAAYLVTGQIVAHVPARWLERARLNFNVILRHLISFAMIALTAGIAARLLELFAALDGSSRRAFAWASLMVLSPPLLSHSFLFFTEIVSAFIALNVFIWLRRSTGKPREAALAGAVVGFLLLLHARNLGLVAGLGVLLMIRARRWPDAVRPAAVAAFVFGAAVLFAVRSAVTFHFWGTWLTTPHARLGSLDGWQPMLAESGVRLIGWLFDQEHGLLPYAPIYLLVPAGWIVLWKRDRELCTAITLVVATYVAVMATPLLNVHGWRGGWTPAARFLVPIAPFLAVLAFSAVAYRPRIPVFVLVLAALQIALDAVLWQYPGLLWNDGIGVSALLIFADRGTGWLSSLVPSIFPPLGARTVAVVAATIVCWGLLTAWLTRNQPPHTQRTQSSY